MPTYTYKCTNKDCEYHDFHITKVHSMKDTEIDHFCSLCELSKIKSLLERVISDITFTPTKSKQPTIKIKV